VHTLFTDIESAFWGFSNSCALAGRDGCKLLTLLHEGATGGEVKRLIEDSYDVGDRPGTCLSLVYPGYDTQLALEIFLTKPAEVVVDPRQMKRGSTFTASLKSYEGFHNCGLQPRSFPPYIIRGFGAISPTRYCTL